MTKGIDKARETAKKIKGSVDSEKAIEKKEMSNALATVKENENLAKLYKDNAHLGSDNLAGSLPLLKIHSVGKSVKNELADGKEPKDGYFFYTKDGTQYESVICHILSISSGYRAPGLGEDKDKKRFNQLMGGVIVDGKDLKPFITYISGKRLNPMWEFGKEASKYTKNSEFPVPLFALKVKLTTRSEKNDYGKSWLIDFEIVKGEGGEPEVITDEGSFVYLKDNVGIIEDTMKKIITNSSDEEIPLPEENFNQEQDFDVPEDA